MEKQISDLLILIGTCCKEMSTTNNIEHFYQLEIYLKDYIKKYVDLNEKRIKGVKNGIK